jgi:hypothetical protein
MTFLIVAFGNIPVEGHFCIHRFSLSRPSLAMPQRMRYTPLVSLLAAPTKYPGQGAYPLSELVARSTCTALGQLAVSDHAVDFSDRAGLAGLVTGQRSCLRHKFRTAQHANKL